MTDWMDKYIEEKRQKFMFDAEEYHYTAMPGSYLHRVWYPELYNALGGFVEPNFMNKPDFEVIGPKYYGSKTIYATPKTLGEYNSLRGWNLPENEDPNRPGYMVQYEDGYISWSPTEAFEGAYRKVDALTFGQAIEALKGGCKVARFGWNGKGMWLALTFGNANLPAEKFWNKHNNKFALDNGGSAEVLPVITMKTADDKILMGWLASQTDMLAEDWVIIEN